MIYLANMPNAVAFCCMKEKDISKELSEYVYVMRGDAEL